MDKIGQHHGQRHHRAGGESSGGGDQTDAPLGRRSRWRSRVLLQQPDDSLRLQVFPRLLIRNMQGLVDFPGDLPFFFGRKQFLHTNRAFLTTAAGGRYQTIASALPGSGREAAAVSRGMAAL